MNARPLVLIVPLVLATVLPSAEATPADVWAFSATFGLPPVFLYPYAGPATAFGAAGIDVSTTVCTASVTGLASCIGAGSCDANPSGGPNVGEGCTGDVPYVNAFGAPATVFECEMVSPPAPFNLFPTFFVAQDVDENGIIDTTVGIDVVIGPSFFFGAFGPTVTGAIFPFGFPALYPGLPVHLILWDPGALLGVWIDIVVIECGAA